MAKIMLVEDDNNLREIYEARLAAEGYEIVSAHDGEEALALAVKERPDLIISDVMMPKISGFDMLDILRGTPETRNTKVIMMTALSQAEDRSRADKLGADRYLVKSQVTLEDVIKVAQDVLNDTNSSGPAALPPAPAPDATNTGADQSGPSPVVAAPPVAAPAPPAPVEPPVPAPEPTPPVEPPKPVEEPVVVPAPPAVPAPEPTIQLPPAPEPPTVVEPPTTSIPVTSEEPEEPKEEKKDDIASAPEAPFEVPTPSAPPVTEAPAEEVKMPEVDSKEIQTKAEETEGVEKQIQDFVSNNPTLSSVKDEPADKPKTAIPVIEVPEPEKEEKPAQKIKVEAAAEPPKTPEEPASRPLASDPAADLPDESKSTEPMAGVKTHDTPDVPGHKKLVIQPTGNATKDIVDLEALLAKEEGEEGIAAPETSTVITPNDPTNDDLSKLDPSQIAL